MGHIHLGVLPQTKKWAQVVELLAAGGDVGEVAAASARAAETDLDRASRDPALVEAVRLLGLVPQAAKKDDFKGALTELGIVLPQNPLLHDLLAAVGMAFDASIDAKRRSDFSEITRRALIGTLTDELGRRLPGLFAPDPNDLQIASRDLASPPKFAGAAREFFTRLLGGSLSYYLSRTLSARVGEARTFSNTSERTNFDAALDQYCWEASRIIREFASGWYSKSVWQDGTITASRAATFSSVAIKKLKEELLRKREVDA